MEIFAVYFWPAIGMMGTLVIHEINASNTYTHTHARANVLNLSGLFIIVICVGGCWIKYSFHRLSGFV